MSDIPQIGWESDHFVTIDDHIMLAGDDLRANIDKVASAFINHIDEVDDGLSRQFISSMFEVAAEDNIDNHEAYEIAKRSFLFAKLIGFCALQPQHVGISVEGVSRSETKTNTEEDNLLETVINASNLELRDSPNFKALIDTHRTTLDPRGDLSSTVDLFAGFALFTMNNALYFASDFERMQSAGESMSEASEEDWQQGLSRLTDNE